MIRHRNGLISLNKRLLLTHGNPLGITAMATRLRLSAESHTAIIENNNPDSCLIGQVLHQSGEKSAHLNFLVMNGDVDTRDVSLMWDELNTKAGEMGALNVLAEVEETSALFEMLRKAGFTSYGWEVVWKKTNINNIPHDTADLWQIAAETDESSMRSLYQSLIPPMVQAAEAWPNDAVRRLLYRENNEIVAYVESSSGPRGLYLRPLIHPAVLNVSELLSSLLTQFSSLAIPVFLQVRSYQAWLLESLHPLGGEVSTQFALMVKHLAVLKRNGVVITQRGMVENRQAEPTAPMVGHLSVDDPPSS